MFEKNLYDECLINDTIFDRIDNLREIRKMELWNEYCYKTKRHDSFIMLVADIDEFATGMAPLELLREYSGIDTYDRFYITGIHGAQSADYISDLVETSEMVKYIGDNLLDCERLLSSYIETIDVCAYMRLNSEYESLIDEYHENPTGVTRADIKAHAAEIKRVALEIEKGI